MATTNKAFRVKTGLAVEGAETRLALNTTTYPSLLFLSTFGGSNAALLTAATQGAMEYDGTRFYLTPASTRKAIALTDSTGVTLDSTITGSSLTSVGTLANLTVTNTITGSVSGSAGSVANSVTFNTTGGAAAGTTYNGSAARTIDYSTVGAAASSHTHGNITNAGAIGSTANLVVVTTTSGAVTVAATPTSASTQFLRGDLTWVVPTDTNYYPTALTYTDGTTAGPVATIAMTGASNITASAIPVASGTVSGVVSTAAQTFAGTKTLTSPVITTSLTTGSASFDLVNTTATTVNFAGAATAVSIGASTGNTTVNNNMIVTGNLTVNGTTTTVNSTTVTVDDVLMELGAVTTPTDVTAEGGGISLFGATNKTITWSATGSNWSSSENWNLVTGKVFKINNTSVLSATTLGSGVTSSSLTKVGALSGGTAGFVKVDASGNLTSDSNTYLTSSTGVTTVNGSSGAITNVALTTGKLSQFAATTSSELAGVISDETGTGALVFAGSPALTGTPTLDGYAGYVAKSGSTTGTTALTFSSVYSSATYNGGEFIIKATNSSNIEIVKVLVITDGTNVYMTTYGEVYVTADLVNIDFTYTTTNVNLVVTPVTGTTGTTSVKVSGTLLAV